MPNNLKEKLTINRRRIIRGVLIAVAVVTTTVVAAGIYKAAKNSTGDDSVSITGTPDGSSFTVSEN